MTKKATNNSESITVLEGVRYKKGSVKIIEQYAKYFVILKLYLPLGIPFSKKVFEFTNLKDAENKYDNLKSYLWYKS